GGISNSGTIQGNIFAIHIPNSNVSHIDLLGQNARIIGGVEAPDTTVNITNGAIFTSEGSYNVDNFNISSNALFNMANTITVANTVNNSGTLATNTLQVIAGNYAQQTGGLFQTEVSSITHYGQLSVNSTADLSQSGNIHVQVAQNVLLHQGNILSNIISGNTFISPTGGFNVTDNSYIWIFLPSLNHSNTGVNLTATINPDAYNVCQGTYCQGAATTIIGQITAGNPIFSPYASLPTANTFQKAVSQATPEIINANIQAIQLITNAVMDIVPMWSTLHGKSGGDAMLYPPGKVWLKPFIASMTQNESNSVNGFNTRANGVVIGKDVQLAQDSLLGGAFSFSRNDIHGNAPPSGQAINSDVYQGMLYGAKRFPNHVYFAGQGLVGYQNNDTKRSIPLYASTANGSFNSWFSNIRAQLGWNAYALSQDLILTPEFDASYLFVNQGSYQESGSPMDLRIASNNNSSLVLGAYGHGAYRLTRLNLQDLTIAAYAGIARNVLNSQPQTTATFVAGGSSFSTYGVQTNKVVFRGGIGLSIENPTKPLRVSLNYDLQTNNTSYSSVGEITIAYKI
ncbi:MAG TPA: autotransporter outer membrane beta-barrel domain-containing protein, partial [Gammaproteobacteria bacterium]|nr:autotransporter outer membrane beta-barrel domain-containing protein [Gammaproteobacteria bacterium]